MYGELHVSSARATSANGVATSAAKTSRSKCPVKLDTGFMGSPLVFFVNGQRVHFVRPGRPAPGILRSLRLNFDCPLPRLPPLPPTKRCLQRLQRRAKVCPFPGA